MEFQSRMFVVEAAGGGKKVYRQFLVNTNLHFSFFSNEIRISIKSESEKRWKPNTFEEIFLDI